MTELKRQGRPPKNGERMTERLMLAVSAGMKQKVADVAALQGITMSEWVRILLAETLGG